MKSHCDSSCQNIQAFKIIGEYHPRKNDSQIVTPVYTIKRFLCNVWVKPLEQALKLADSSEFATSH